MLDVVIFDSILIFIFHRYQLAVVNANIDSSCSNLIPGQTLCLAENAAEDCSTTYVVRSGDTCEDIASRAGLNTTILSLNNPQINAECTNIYTDEVRFFKSPAIAVELQF